MLTPPTLQRVRRALEPTGCGEYVRRRRVAGAVNACCPPGGLVVDLGGGPGRLHAALRPDLRARYLVVDVPGAGLGLRVGGDLLRVPLAGGVADVVCVSDVLEHVADDAALIREAVRVVRPGGQVVVHVPSLRSKPAGFLRRAAEEAEEADQQRFPHVRDGYEASALGRVLAGTGGVAVASVAPSFTAVQSLVSDVDAWLWWRRLTPLRALPWSLIRLAPDWWPPPREPTSSGLVAVLRRTG